jgi:hypothetical protein
MLSECTLKHFLNRSRIIFSLLFLFPEFSVADNKNQRQVIKSENRGAVLETVECQTDHVFRVPFFLIDTFTE